MTQRPYLHLLAALERDRVRYAIGGGIAAVLHGVPRMTFDLDLIVDLADDNMEALVATLGHERYVPRLPVALADLADRDRRREWTEQRNLIAFSLHHPDRLMEEVDIILVPLIPWSEVATSLEHRTLDGTSVTLLGRAILRKMKLATGREKDRVDAELLGDGDD